MIIWTLLVDFKFQALLQAPASVDVEPSSTIEQMKAKVIEEYGVNLRNATTGNLSVWKTRDDSNLNISLPNFEEILENIDEVRNAIRRITGDERVGDLGLVSSQILLVRYVKKREEEIIRYQDLFIKVKEWGKAFVDSDLDEGNDVKSSSSVVVSEQRQQRVPDFVKNSEGQLDRKPSLNSDRYDAYKRTFNIQFQSLDTYLERTTVEDESPEEFTSESECHRRDVGDAELSHLTRITINAWEQLWKEGSLKEPLMYAIFFAEFVVDNHPTITAQTGHDKWPLNLIVKCETAPRGEQLRKYQPRSDFMFIKSNLPRLLVEVNSKPKRRNNRPEDLIRMLLCGAAVVRFANTFLDRFKKAKDFVLFAMYVKDRGGVTRFSLYQMPDKSGVYYHESHDDYDLNTSNGRAEFVRQLYSLCHLLEMEEEAGDTEINRLHEVIRNHHKQHPMKLFHTKGPKSSHNKDASDDTTHTSDDTTHTSDDNDRSAGGGAGNEDAELRAHGYDVEPGDYDEKGQVTMFFKRPPHIFVVYLRSDRRKRFVAKKTREGSNELEIFKILSTLPKSEHIISLHESFQTQSALWVITPEMSSVAKCVSLLSGELNGKVVEVCWGLINGVAHLHKFCIAHRDIKPENLVVDKNFTLKIIDFDSAMQVMGEDEVVDGICGTEGWMAPELVRKSMYSPIRVDRWSTGKVIFYLLDKCRKEDEDLMMIVSKLTTDDPEQRSDVANVVISRKASRSLQDPMPSKAKKQKLYTPIVHKEVVMEV